MQRFDVAVAAQNIAQITGDGAHVAAFAADHFKNDVVGVGALDHFQFLDPKRAGFDFNFFASTGQFIGALAVNFYGGKLRWHLHDVTSEFWQSSTDFIVGRTRVRCGDHFAFGIICICGLTQTHCETIGFLCVRDIGHGFGGLAQCNRQNAGRFGIKCAGVPRLLRIHRPADLVHHGIRGDAHRFVDHQPARYVTAFFASASHVYAPDPRSWRVVRPRLCVNG